MNFLRRILLSFYKKRNPVKYARLIGVRLGKNCRLIRVEFSSEPWLIKLGDHVSATATRFETHDGGVWVLRDEHPSIDNIRGITVGNNVFIGYGSIIMPGVTIGNNVVIGAGSIVTRDIPENVVAVGAPARVLRSLDEYKERSLRVGQMTKYMTPDEKRRHYLGPLESKSR